MMFVKANLARDEFGGVGVYAAEDIKKGDVVWREHPDSAVCVSLSEYRALPQADPEQAEFLEHFSYPGYSMQNGQQVPVLEFATDIGSFVNHGETPNLETSTYVDEKGDPKLNDIAVRDIHAGDQILYNYRSFVPDVSLWHNLTKVRTGASFLIEPRELALRAPKSKWRDMAAFDVALQRLLKNLQILRQSSRSSADLGVAKAG